MQNDQFVHKLEVISSIHHCLHQCHHIQSSKRLYLTNTAAAVPQCEVPSDIDARRRMLFPGYLLRDISSDEQTNKQQYHYHQSDKCIKPGTKALCVLAEYHYHINVTKRGQTDGQTPYRCGLFASFIMFLVFSSLL